MPSTGTTEELHERLERRVCGIEGQGHRAYLFKEVQIEGRRADAVSVGLWPSRGIKIEGFELKNNRADWVREREDHAKAEPAMAICDHFWLVTNPGVLMPGELPEKWGLLLYNGRRRHLTVEKEAPSLRPELEEPISRLLLPTLLRRAADVRWQEVNKVREELAEQARKAAERDYERLENRLATATEANERYSKAWETFLRTSGLDFYEWLGADADRMELVGEIARALRGGPQEMRGLATRLQRMKDETTGLVDRLGEAITAAEAGAAPGKSKRDGAF